MAAESKEKAAEQTLIAELDAAIAEGATIDDITLILAGEGLGVTFDDAGQAIMFECAPGDEDDEQPVLTETPPEQPEGAARPKVAKGKLLRIMERVGNVLEGKGLANWFLGKRRKVLSDLADAEELADRNIRQINQFIARQRRAAENRTRMLDWLLLGFLDDTQEKALKLPEGTVAWEKARVETEWDMQQALVFAVSKSIGEAQRLAEEWAATEAGQAATAADEGAAQDYLWARFAELLGGLVDVKKTPVKNLLDKRQDGSFGYVNDDGEQVTVIAAHETGVVPREPLVAGADPEAVRKPLPWCKPGETYKQVIKLT